MRVLVATDAIGELGSLAAGRAIASGWAGADVKVLPVGEAGAGFLSSFADQFGGQVEQRPGPATGRHQCHRRPGRCPRRPRCRRPARGSRTRHRRSRSVRQRTSCSRSTGSAICCSIWPDSGSTTAVPACLPGSEHGPTCHSTRALEACRGSARSILGRRWRRWRGRADGRSAGGRAFPALAGAARHHLVTWSRCGDRAGADAGHGQRAGTLSPRLRRRTWRMLPGRAPAAASGSPYWHSVAG